MKKFALAFAAAALTVTAAPAMAAELPTKSANSISSSLLDTVAHYDDDDDRKWRGRGHKRGHYKNRNRNRDRSSYRGRDQGYVYDSRGFYYNPRRITRNSYMWRGDNGRYHCRRDNGTTGLVIGAGVGALAGHQIAGRSDRTIGAILGGVVGGLVGREIDRGSLQCR